MRRCGARSLRLLPVVCSLGLHAAAIGALLAAGRLAPYAEAPAAMGVQIALLPAGAATPAVVPAQPQPPHAQPQPQPQPPAHEAPPALPAPPPAPPPTASLRHAPRHPPEPARPQAAATSAPSAPSAPAPPPAEGGGGGQPSSAWLAALDAWIDSHLGYPPQARRRGEEGLVLVRLVVAHDGHLLAFALLKSSGHPALDEAARALFRGARLPAAPSAADPPEAVLEKPIRFRLR
jgi:protein TonB